MLRYGLAVTLTAVCCFAIAAATGLGAPAARTVTLATGEVATYASDSLYCEMLTTTEAACGARLAPNAVLVYFAPHQIEVVKFASHTTSKEAILLNIKR